MDRMAGRTVAVALLLLLRAAARAEEPSVSFLDGDAGRDAIADEKIEPYFSLLEPMDMATKTGELLHAKEIAAQREECRERYRAAVRTFTAGEKAALTALVGRIHAAWADEYPLFAETPWSFVKVAPTIEGGMPCTRGRSILLPESAVALVARVSGRSPGSRDAGFARLLVHEQAHVVQRLHPEAFAPLYTGSWGFAHADRIEGNEWLEHRKIVNPDGVDLRWVFPEAEAEGTTYLQPFLVLSDGPEPRRMPEDIEELAVSLVREGETFRVKTDAKGMPVVRPLHSVRAYEERFGSISEGFHPNEIFACLFSEMVVRDHFGGRALARPCDLVGPDFGKLRAYCREHFRGK
jgi:hypothetical protein